MYSSLAPSQLGYPNTLPDFPCVASDVRLSKLPQTKEEAVGPNGIGDLEIRANQSSATGVHSPVSGRDFTRTFQDKPTGVRRPGDKHIRRCLGNGQKWRRRIAIQ